MASQTKSGGKKKSTSAAKKHSRKPKRSWSRYVHRALAAVAESGKVDVTISSRAMAIMNSFCGDIFERLATEAAHVARVHKRSTLGCPELQAAVKLTLPAELSKHAIAEAMRVVSKK